MDEEPQTALERYKVRLHRKTFMRLLSVVGLGAVLAGLASCGNNSIYGSGGGSGGRTSSIQVEDNFYSVTPDTVAVDDTITWSWAGISSHSVTFSSGASSATQSTGTFKRTFSPAGTYTYHCVVHGVAMSGVIVAQ